MSKKKNQNPKLDDLASIASFEKLVKRTHNVPGAFPKAVAQEAASLPAEIPASELKGREDLRDVPFVTIDGEDARDFDDAIHVERIADGQWLLRVAIADVSHYVSQKTTKALDAEALVRSNSQYFPMSVEPMLPEVLSNGLCSLAPWQDRLVVLTEFTVAADAPLGKPRFALGVMRSHGRLTYDQVKACILDRDSAQLAALMSQPSGADVVRMLGEAFEVYRVLRAARLARGAMDFDLRELETTIDSQKQNFSLTLRHRHDAHRLIEECMIAANEAVASHLEESGVPCLFRVHSQPETTRLQELFSTLKASSLSVAWKLPAEPTLPGILALAHGAGDEEVVIRCCLRAMPKATYDTENIGHFGLASQAYCHFTSPIRRYADLVTHRALRQSMGWQLSHKVTPRKLKKVASVVNAREYSSTEAERDMAKRLGCLMMARRNNQELPAIVTGTAVFGLFMEIEGIPGVEGLLHVSNLPPDQGSGSNRNGWDDFDDDDYDEYDDFDDDDCDYGYRRYRPQRRRSSVKGWMLGMRGKVRITEVFQEAVRISLVPSQRFYSAIAERARQEK